MVSSFIMAKNKFFMSRAVKQCAAALASHSCTFIFYGNFIMQLSTGRSCGAC